MSNVVNLKRKNAMRKFVDGEWIDLVDIDALSPAERAAYFSDAAPIKHDVVAPTEPKA